VITFSKLSLTHSFIVVIDVIAVIVGCDTSKRSQGKMPVELQAHLN